MAYQENEEDILDPNAPPPTTGPAGGATLGQGTGMAGSAGAAPATAKASAPTGVSPFVGIKQYLDANKTQTGKLAENVGGVVEGLGTKARETLPGQTNLYNQEVDKNTINLNKDIFNEAKTNAQGVAGDAGKKFSFQTMRDAQYRGPSDFQTSAFYKPVDESFKKATKATEDTKTEQGQRSLINTVQQEKTGRQAGQGVTTFDQMLLQSSPDARVRLDLAAQRNADLGGLLDRTNQEARARAQKAADTTSATRQAIQNEFGGGGGSSQQALERMLQQRTKDRIAQSNAQTSRLRQAASRGEDLSDQDLALLGVDRGSYKGLQESMGLAANTGFGGGLTGDPTQDFSQFFRTVNPEDRINAQNVASAEDYARYAALNDLMGTNNKFLSNPSMAGRANLDAVDFDAQAAKESLAAQILAGQRINMPNIDFSMPKINLDNIRRF